VETLEISVFFLVASFLLFPMAISVNDQQNKNGQSDGEEIDNERFVSQNIAHEIGEIGIHLRSIFGQFTPHQGKDKTMAEKDSCRLLLLMQRNRRYWKRLLDSLSLSRHGESSSEPSSVMILDPAFGNSLWKAKFVGQ
jgi:hypothetical protein